MGGVLGAERRSGKTQTTRVLRPLRRRPCRLGKPASSPEAAATPAALVLGNDDLLREVLLRLALPVSLARAACVCKRRRRVASDPTFLHTFRALHPPRLLGSFPSDRTSWNPRLLPCPGGLPDELAAMARRANSYLSRISEQEPGRYEILDARNGRVLFYVTDMSDPIRLVGTMICAPLLPEPSVYLPLEWLSGGTYSDTNNQVEVLEIFQFLPEDGGDGLSYFEVRLVKHRRRKPNVVFAALVSCQAGVAGECHATPPILLPNGLVWSSCSRQGLLCGGKFYMLSKDRYILGLDLVAMSLFYIHLPGELLQQEQDREAIGGDDSLKSVCLSRGEGSKKFYLIHIKGLKVFVWLHDAERGSNNAASSWALVDTVCLLQVFAPVAKNDLRSRRGRRIHLLQRGGDNAEFVYLSILDATDGGSRIDYLLHIKRRAVEKVFEEDRHTTYVLYPFTMVCPSARTE